MFVAFLLFHLCGPWALWLFQAVADSAATSSDANIVISRLGWAAACAYLVKLAQKWSKLPWITQHTASINTAARLITSGIATLGITMTWNGAAHSLTINNLSMAVILSGAWHWFTQYALQHGWGQLFSVSDQAQQK